MATDEERRVIDEKGRVTIPKFIRERLHLEPGEAVDIDVEDGTVRIRPRFSREEFVESMRGCITQTSRRSTPEDVTPEDVKADWLDDLPTG